MKTVLIVGGGLGGLFTGAILAKEGLRVTVIEKNATIGGGLQTFRRGGVAFDTGMHVIGGMQPGGNIRRICRYLGILDQVTIRHVDDDCTDALYFAEDRRTYRIRKGPEGYVDSLCEHFPEARGELKAYVEAIYAMTREVALFSLKPDEGWLTMHSPDFMMAADDFIAKYVKNEKLRSVIAYMNPLYGGRHGETPAFIHAIISVLYIDGASRFEGGADRFAHLLAGVITSHGGEIVTADPVEHIDVADRHVGHVVTRSGRRFAADTYISAIHPCTMLRLMPDGALPKAYRRRLDSIPNSYSAFSVYIKLRPGTFEYVNHSEYYMTAYRDIWNFGEQGKAWPMGFLFMTPPDEGQTRYASKALITAPMLFDEVRRWEDTTVGRRGREYGEWKDECCAKLLRLVEEMHPGFGKCIDSVTTASPLTIRDFYGVKEGAMCGFSKDCNNIALSQVPVVTKIDNLLLTGQNNNLHGFSGVPLTAINTAEAILGKNYVINKINEGENALHLK